MVRSQQKVSKTLTSTSHHVYTLDVEKSYTITNNTGLILTITGTNADTNAAINPITIPVSGSHQLTVADGVDYALNVHTHTYRIYVPTEDVLDFFK